MLSASHAGEQRSVAFPGERGFVVRGAGHAPGTHQKPKKKKKKMNSAVHKRHDDGFLVGWLAGSFNFFFSQKKSPLGVFFFFFAVQQPAAPHQPASSSSIIHLFHTRTTPLKESEISLSLNHAGTKQTTFLFFLRLHPPLFFLKKKKTLIKPLSRIVRFVSSSLHAFFSTLFLSRFFFLLPSPLGAGTGGYPFVARERM